MPNIRSEVIFCLLLNHAKGGTALLKTVPAEALGRKHRGAGEMDKGKTHSDSTPKVTMTDIAKKVGVSKNAVSLALSNKKGVSEETRKRILDACELMGYQYTAAHSGLDVIELMVPVEFVEDTYFFTKIIAAIEKAVKSNQYALHLTVLDKESSFEARLKNSQAAGLIILSDIGADRLKEIEKSHLPAIVVDHYDPNLELDTLMVDNAYGVIKVLADMKAKKIKSAGFIGDIRAAVSYAERWEAFKMHAPRYGIEVHEAYCFLGEKYAYDVHYGKDRACYLNDLRNFLNDLNSYPDALFCVSNPVTALAYSTLLAKGLSMPQNIGLSGFDDSEFMRHCTPAISMVNIDKYHYGLVAVEHLLTKIKYPNKPTELTRVRPAFIKRESL